MNTSTELEYIHGRVAALHARLREHEERQKRSLGRWAGAGAGIGALAGLRSAQGCMLSPDAPLRVGDVVARKFAGGLAEHRGVVVPGEGGKLSVVHAARSGAGQRIVSQPMSGFRASAVHPVADGTMRQAAARQAVSAIGQTSGYNVLAKNSDAALRKVTGLRFPLQVGRAVTGAAIGAGAGIMAAKLIHRRENEERNRRLLRAFSVKRAAIVRLADAKKRLVQLGVTPLALPGATIGGSIADKLRRAASRIPSSALVTGGAGLAAGAALGRMTRPDRAEDDQRPGASLLRRAVGGGLGAYVGQRWLSGPLGKLAAQRGLLGAVGRNPRLAGAVLGGLTGTLLEVQRARSLEMLSAKIAGGEQAPEVPGRIAEMICTCLEQGSEQKLRPHTVKSIARRAMMPEEDIRRAIESGILQPATVKRASHPMFRQSDVEALRAESLRQVCLEAIKANPNAPPRQVIYICRGALNKALRPGKATTPARE